MMQHNDIDIEIAKWKLIRYVPLVWGDGSVTLNVADGDKMRTLPFWSSGDVYDLFWELPESERVWLAKNAMIQKATFDDGRPLMGYDHEKVIERWLDWKKGNLPLNVRLNKNGQQEVW